MPKSFYPKSLQLKRLSSQTLCIRCKWEIVKHLLVQGKMGFVREGDQSKLAFFTELHDQMWHGFWKRSLFVCVFAHIFLLLLPHSLRVLSFPLLLFFTLYHPSFGFNLVQLHCFAVLILCSFLRMLDSRLFNLIISYGTF